MLLQLPLTLSFFTHSIASDGLSIKAIVERP